jgi:hypothetical protein
MEYSPALAPKMAAFLTYAASLHPRLPRAEVMAAATAHLGDSSPTYRSPNQQRALYQPTPVDTSADLVRAARDEVERGMRLSAQEVHSRRAPPKLQGLGHAGWKI